MSFRPRNRVNTKKKKVITTIWDYIQPEFLGFIRAEGPFLANQPALKSRWGTPNLDGGTLTLDGGKRPPRPRYNLNTVSRVLGASEQAAN